ncbi:hypothetical protein SSS_01691 [Sarcoptes scabiei]|uniref:Uncharacterized protein n=1 Tax=Sarcoptes scabiei TaxID=52283 RepID=A0A834R4N8_SARSC|nr:hypothetical protein SSS_01691 [Sarcoptes scabiei]
MVKRKNKNSRCKASNITIPSTSTNSTIHSDCSSDMEELEVAAVKNARFRAPTDTTLEKYITDPDLVENLTVSQHIDIIDTYSKLEDCDLKQRYTDLYQTVSNNLRKMTTPIQNQNSSELEKIFTELGKINQNISNLQLQVDKINQKIDTPTAPSPIITKSYSQALQTQRPIQTYKHNTQEQKTIIVKSSTPNQIQPKILETQVKQIISQTKSNAKITKITTNKSAVVINSVETDQENFERLLKNLNDHPSNSNQFKAFTPKKLDPTITLKDVSIDNNISTIVTQLTNNNPELLNKENGIKFLFKMKHYNPRYMNLVFRVSPEIYQIINDKMNNNVFIDFQRCRTEHKVLVRQCQKCFLFNHKTADCKNTMICKKCSHHKEHGHKCADEQQKCCSNCKNSNFYKNNTNHYPNSEECPFYRTQITRQLEKTQFYPSLQNL